jgi:hypothetical protein
MRATERNSGLTHYLWPWKLVFVGRGGSVRDSPWRRGNLLTHSCQASQSGVPNEYMHLESNPVTDVSWMRGEPTTPLFLKERCTGAAVTTMATMKLCWLLWR